MGCHVRQYITASDGRPFLDWYIRQDGRVQAAFVATVQIVEALPLPILLNEKKCKEFKVLRGKHKGLCEIRFWMDPRVFRGVGVLLPSDDGESAEFILFRGLEKLHGGQVEVPAGAFDNALVLKQALENGEGYAHDLF